MIYLLTQILLCLALAGLCGGAIGWLMQRARGAQRLDAARRALAAQGRQLERARTDVTMLTDDFDDLRERSRVEIDGLRQENRQLPVLSENLEKSQLLVRQMLQRHESREREFESGKAALEKRLAMLQEQVVTQERTLAAATRGVGTQEARAIAAANDTLAGDDTLPEATSGASSTAGSNESTTSAAMAAAAAAALGGVALGGAASGGATPSTTASTTPEEDVDATTADTTRESSTPQGTTVDAQIDTLADPAVGAGAEGNAATLKQGSWASRTLLQASTDELGDESMDEVMEVDEDLAAELLDGIDTPSPSSADDTFDSSLNDTLDESVTIRAAVRSSSERSRGWTSGSNPDPATVDYDRAAAALDDDDDWDEEEANATLAVEVFSMDDVHGVDGLADSASFDESQSPTLFQPVTRQDDLKRLHGIGAGTEKALNALGITSYPQLARLKRPEIEKLAEALEIGPERIEDDDWVGNARRQLEKVLEEL